jgi:peptidyl-prolyl cis-trans isomerase SurA
MTIKKPKNYGFCDMFSNIGNLLKPCKYYIHIGLFLWILLTISHARAEIVDRIIAVVNDEIISLYDLNQLIKPYMERIKAEGFPPEKERIMLFKVRDDLLNQAIEKKLADQEIKRTGIEVSEKEVDATIERIKETNYYTDEDLRAALAQEGLTLEEYRKRMKEQILRTRLVNYEIKSKIVITNEDIKAYYESNKDQYGTEKKYHLRNIIMKPPPFADKAEKLEVLQKMESVRAKLDSGRSFEALAREYSESSLASEGGDLGLFSFDELSPQIQKAIQGLKAGDFTPVLDTEQGYQIFFIEEIVRTSGITLEQASPEIEEKLYAEIVNKKYKSWLDDLRKRSHIKIIK